MRFAGKTVVITGAASGIGLASVHKFAAEGAYVVAADIDAAAGEELAATSNGTIVFKRTDVCNVDDIRALMDFAAEKSGGIDVVFNNAGAGGDRAPIDEIDADGWDRTMNLLLRSVAMGIRFAAPHMKGRKGASIINTASVAALRSGYSPTAYAVAKAGVLHLTKCAATDLAQHGIRVNAVQPGFINTNIFTATMEVPKEQVPVAKAAIAALSQHAQPVARGGQADDIAGMALFLASDDAGFITGTHMLVDGGLTAGERHSWDPAAPGLFDALEAIGQAGQ